MRVKEIPRTVYDRVYVAKDGREFKSMEECEAYEISIDDVLKRELEVAEAVEKLEIKDMEDYCWITTDGAYVSDNAHFKWYELNNEEDLKMLDEFYNDNDCDYLNIDKKINYPDIVCVEDWEGEISAYLVSKMIKEVANYFERLNYKVTIEKE